MNISQRYCVIDWHYMRMSMRMEGFTEVAGHRPKTTNAPYSLKFLHYTVQQKVKVAVKKREE